MGGFRPLGAVLFFYECIRLLLLVVFLLLAPQEGSVIAILPVYLSSNALFPLMALFLWLRPEEYRSYFALYMAGKIITLASFYVWVAFSSRELSWLENAAWAMLILGGSVFISLADIISVWCAWVIKSKFSRTPGDLKESGGV